MVNHQRVGLHVSAAGGVENAPGRAKELGAECFQFFSRSPRGGPAPNISDEQAKQFREACENFSLESYIHTPYYINFASQKSSIYQGSINVVREELERGSKLGVKYVMTHMGSAAAYAPDASGSRVPAAALKHAIAGLKKVFEGKPKFTTQLLLEISAGAGAVLGDSFEELVKLVDGLGRDDVGICLDTCHLFASGYDLRTPEAVANVMKEYKKILGSESLKLVHMNDSKAGLGEHKDRHEHIGKGEIGSAGFKAMLAHPDFQKVNFILETKHDEEIQADLDFLKKHRQQ